jgi:hypothetical protein
MFWVRVQRGQLRSSWVKMGHLFWKTCLPRLILQQTFPVWYTLRRSLDFDLPGLPHCGESLCIALNTRCRVCMPVTKC